MNALANTFDRAACLLTSNVGSESRERIPLPTDGRTMDPMERTMTQQDQRFRELREREEEHQCGELLRGAKPPPFLVEKKKGPVPVRVGRRSVKDRGCG